MAARAPALELLHINKRYGGVTALEDAGLAVRPGTIHAVLGENGAGKTTLMRVAYGMVRPDAGEVRVAGRQLRVTSPASAIAAGLGMVHQQFTLVPTMTVAENLALGGRGRLRTSEMAARVNAIAKHTGFALDPDARVETLPVGAQQRVEIAKALVRHATLLILDEPTAVLAPSEIEDLLRWLRSYVSEGNAALLITHKLREALAVADDVTVLRRGRVEFAGVATSTSPEQLIQAMMGVALDSDGEPSDSMPPLGSTPMFAARHVNIVDRDGRTRVHDATFEVRCGELVGIAAVEGSGQRELLRALAGRCGISGGTLDRPNIVGFVPEDRHHDAMLLDRSLAENVALRGAGPRQGALSWKRVHANTVALVTSYDVRAESTQMPARALSGGNQQKLVLARELEATFDQPAPKALVVENPTRGLDVRASAAVHQRLREAGARGAAVIIYSSDLDEVLSLCARVLVMHAGMLRELPSADREAIGRAMLGLRS
ncbi:MAG: ATP-binding cassette domain-containing protein [bacterium]